MPLMLKFKFKSDDSESELKASAYNIQQLSIKTLEASQPHVAVITITPLNFLTVIAEITRLSTKNIL